MTDSIKRRGADGVVYERLSGRAHIPENSKDVRDLHWCSGTGDNPARISLDTPAHFCFIWARAEDQSWEPSASRIPSDPIPLDELFQQVELIIEEGSQSQLAKIQTLALLYQAKALESIAAKLDVLSAPYSSMVEDLVKIGMPRSQAEIHAFQDFYERREKHLRGAR